MKPKTASRICFTPPVAASEATTRSPAAEPPKSLAAEDVQVAPNQDAAAKPSGTALAAHPPLQKPAKRSSVPAAPAGAAFLSMPELSELVGRTVKAAFEDDAPVRAGRRINGVAFVARYSLATQDPSASAASALHDELQKIWQTQRQRIALVGIQHGAGEKRLRSMICAAAVKPSHNFLVFTEGFVAQGSPDDQAVDRAAILGLTHREAATLALRDNLCGLEVWPASFAALLADLYGDFGHGHDRSQIIDRLRRLLGDFVPAQKDLVRFIDASRQPHVKAMMGMLSLPIKIRSEDVDPTVLQRFFDDYLPRVANMLSGNKRVREAFNLSVAASSAGRNPNKDGFSSAFLKLNVVERNKAWIAQIRQVLAEPQHKDKKVVIVCGLGHLDDLEQRLGELASPSGRKAPGRTRR